MKKDLLKETGVTKEEVLNFLSIHNSAVSIKHPYKYMLKIRKSIDTLENVDWYKDAVILIQLTKQLNVPIRTYIIAQISRYRKPNKKSREVPTIKMMYSEKGIERYFEYVRSVKQASDVHVLTEEEKDAFSLKKLNTLMIAYDVASVEDFFKDMFLSSQLSRHFILNHPVYISLRDSGFYKKEYGSDFPFILEG